MRLFPIFCLFLLGAVFLIYGQTFSFQFVFDDTPFITANPYIRNVFGFLNAHVFPLNRLLTLYTFELNYRWYGLDPAGYHKFNFIIHMASVFSVWWLARILFIDMRCSAAGFDRTRAQCLAFFTALLFAVHPIQTQAISYVTQRFAALSALFYVLAVASYMKARMGRRRVFFFGLTGLFTVMAFLSKEESVTLPLMFLLTECVFFLKGMNIVAKKRFLAGIVIAVLAGIFFAAGQFSNPLRAALNQSAMPSSSHDGDMITMIPYVLTQLRVFWISIGLFFFPVAQMLDYDIAVSHSFWEMPVFMGFAGVVLLCWLAFFARKTEKIISLGIGWIFIAFLSNLFPRVHLFWEHRLYLVSVGFCLALTAFLALSVRNTRVLIVLLMALSLGMGFAAHERNKVWVSDLVLWTDNIAKTPDKIRTNLNLGGALLANGFYQQSGKYFKKVLSLNPLEPRANMGMGAIAQHSGHWDEAGKYYAGVIERHPDVTEPYTRMIGLYLQKKDTAGALKYANHIIARSPLLADGYLWRANILQFRGRYNEALDDFSTALVFNPQSIDAVIGMGKAYFLLQEYEKAFDKYMLAVQLDPGNARGHLSLAELFHNMGDRKTALKEFRRAQQINPQDSTVANVGKLLSF